MSTSALLSRLHTVRESAPGRWIARCPAHEDRAPSLSIRELDDGRVLVHDFAGCSATDVLAAVGLELKDLYPARLDHHRPPSREQKHQHAARDALRLLDKETLIVAIAAEMTAGGAALGRQDRERLLLAAGRIRRAAEVAV